MPQNKRYIYVNAFEGQPKVTDFELVLEDVPPLSEGEILCEAMYFSVDPHLWTHSCGLAEGQTMMGTQVSKVVESRAAEWPVGSLLVLDTGWQLYSVCDSQRRHRDRLRTLPDLHHLPASLALGPLGTLGLVAYFGLVEVCRPEQGEVVAVSSAAGAVGSLVGQIAHIKGCKVVGITSSEKKAAWLRALGFDTVVNYKAKSEHTLVDVLQEAVPEGIDCYFDNVGGEISAAVMSVMNTCGRVACCGALSVYNRHSNLLNKGYPIEPFIIDKQLRMEGVSAERWVSRQEEAWRVLTKWLVEEKIHFHESVYEGFEMLPEALIKMLEGHSMGKAIVRA